MKIEVDVHCEEPGAHNRRYYVFEVVFCEYIIKRMFYVRYDIVKEF